MPGWMGIRGLEPRNPHDMERRRRGENKNARGDTERRTRDTERRAKEKVREILREQQGDMSAYTGNIRPERQSDCDGISALSVTEIMSGRVAVLSFDDTLFTVQGIFERVRFHHLPVVDEVGNVIGILSDRDFLRMISPFFGTINEQNRDKEIMHRKAGTIMTRNPVCVSIMNSIQDAVRIMHNNKISCLPIVEPGGMKLLGIVTWKDVVRAFCPRAFTGPRDSERLRVGVEVNPETSESARMRARQAQENRPRPPLPSDSARLLIEPEDDGT